MTEVQILAGLSGLRRHIVKGVERGADVRARWYGLTTHRQPRRECKI